MTKLGRNDPCSCGSGKKYKKCCLVSIEAADSEYLRWRRIEASLIPRLLEHAFITFGEESILDAWAEFNDEGWDEDDDPELGDESDREETDEFDLEPDDESDDSYDPELPMNMVFMPWFLFNWTTFEITDDGGSMPSEMTIAESFMQTQRSRLSLDEVMLLSSLNRCRFTFCEVIEIKPGVGMKQFDLLRRSEYEVIEHAASHTLRRGDIIYCATTRIGEVRSNLATGPYSLRPTAKRDVLELRDWILAESNAEEITDGHLEDYEADIRDLYLDLVEPMFGPPDIRNTDNDPMLPQKLYFEINSAEQTFHALKDLAEGVDESDLRADAQLEEGSLRSVEIPWFGGNAKARKRLAGPVLLGNIQIDDREMIIEVNSNERAELIRQLVEERLGNDVKYKTTLIEPLPAFESIESELEAAAAAGEDATQSIFSFLDDSPPELLTSLDEANRQLWEFWFEDPIPALNNLTPREAAKTERGRDLLESLLLEYESRQHHSPDNPFTPDIDALRRELGLK